MKVGIAGVTGLIGDEILKILDEASWRPEVVPMARAASTTAFVSYGEEQLTVEDLAQETFEDLDLLFVALPREAASPIVAKASAAGTPVVDLSGSQLQDLDSPLVVPWVNGQALQAERPRDVVTIPSGAGLALGSIVSAFQRMNWNASIEADLQMSASVLGRKASEELSKQVIAMFNSAPAPRKIFEQGLAFDQLPMVGHRSDSGWTNVEFQVVAEVARMCGTRTTVSLSMVPLFSGVVGQVRIALDRPRDLELVKQVLKESGVVVVDDQNPRQLPRPRKVQGEAFPHVSRLRFGADEQTVFLWLAVDNVHATAAAAVSAAASVLSQQGREVE